MCRKSYYEKLSHAIMEIEKSHDLSSPSWRPKLVVEFQFKPKSLSTRRTNGVNPNLSPEAQSLTFSPEVQESEELMS